MESLSLEKQLEFIKVLSGSGFGDGYGYGSGFGSGFGDGSGSGFGDGSGSGSGFGSGFGDGYGSGSGFGYGSGSGSGSGSGFGSGSGSGFGSGFGDGSGSGSGFGSGSGSGFGSGFGDGYGSGSGFGSGFGSGSGSGSGFGDGSGIKKYNNSMVHKIDNINTILTFIKGDIAKGFTLNSDLTSEKCYVIKQNNLFAHGKTLREAKQALEDKLFNDLDIEEKISLFIKEFKLGELYPASAFFDWHFKLTGSCDFGRRNFAKNHNINLENDFMTVAEFMELTQYEYGEEIIKKLKDTIDERTN